MVCFNLWVFKFKWNWNYKKNLPKIIQFNRHEIVLSQQKDDSLRANSWKLVIAQHPSIHFLYPLNPTQGRRRAGAYPSCHWTRGGIHPGHVASPSQGHTETNEHPSMLTPRVKLESPVNLTCMFLCVGRKLEYLERPHIHKENVQTPQKGPSREATVSTTTPSGPFLT